MFDWQLPQGGGDFFLFPNCLAALWCLLWAAVVWCKTHLCDSTFFRNTGWRPAKVLWAVIVPTEWTGAWAFATLTSLCQCPGLFFKDQELYKDPWISLQWMSFVFKWERYFSSREQILLVFVLFLFKLHLMVKSVVRISIWGVLIMHKSSGRGQNFF